MHNAIFFSSVERVPDYANDLQKRNRKLQIFISFRFVSQITVSPLLVPFHSLLNKTVHFHGNCRLQTTVKTNSSLLFTF